MSTEDHAGRQTFWAEQFLEHRGRLLALAERNRRRRVLALARPLRPDAHEFIPHGVSRVVI